MTGPRSQSWSLLPPLVRLILLLASAATSSFATGYYGPTVYLEEGGRHVTGSPEFYWELEVKRLARDFHPPEKFVFPSAEDLPKNSEATREEKEAPLIERTSRADLEDFENALKEARIKPPDAAQATEQHKAAREAIAQRATGNLPAEFASEFADYHRGAFAFAQGVEHWGEAREAWEGLLARPAEERHYRSVWAAFMLGKLTLKNMDEQAATWFQKARGLAREGFADSLGMAADSYGWEARSEWKHGRPEKAAPLYLTQLALGDESAVISLKALVPDRTPVGGMLNYGPEPEERSAWDDLQRSAEETKEIAALKAAARDPLLRRLVTVHVLATQSEPFIAEDTGRPAVPRAARWLGAIREAKIAKIADAEYLGWIAYGDGKYEQAARWLALSDGESPAALWLKSKLQRRAGKLDDAVRTMAKACEAVLDTSVYTGWNPASGPYEADEVYGSFEGGHWRFEQSASGDLGGLRLARAEFVDALDAFVDGSLWSDAAFIAERVLTLDELKKYVDAQPIPPPPAEPDSPDDSAKLRYMLGRRLVREDRYVEAPPYFPPLYAKRLETYLKALKDGAAPQLSKEERARAYFTAAWIARYDGMELMGTEGAPDAFISGGDFPEPDLAKERQAGTFVKTSYDNAGTHETRVAVELKPSAKEKERLAKHKIRPDVRFHYRVIAAALAMRAADLLPDNSEELAETLNAGGSWAQDRDQKLAEQCFLILRKRAANTSIGRAAIAKRWFVSQPGTWSKEETDARATALGKPESSE